MMKRLAKKLCSGRGFTLTEMLAAVVVLAVLCVAIGSGVSATINVYQKMTASSEAAILMNTLTLAVSDELQYATDIEIGDTEAGGYTSAVYGPGTRLYVTDSGRIAVEKTSVDSGGNAVTTVYYLVSDKTYTSGLRAEMEISYDEVSTVDLEILDKDGAALISSEFSVSTLNT
ncbi:MAG: prepilin-type N-terminal cleavage/methylation domain-containing protein [Oscillospiraceae bacterium]